MQGGIGLKVNPVLGVKFYLAKILACSGKNGILFPALRGHGKVLGVLPTIASFASVLQQFKNFFADKGCFLLKLLPLMPFYLGKGLVKLTSVYLKSLINRF